MKFKIPKWTCKYPLSSGLQSNFNSCMKITTAATHYLVSQETVFMVYSLFTNNTTLYTIHGAVATQCCTLFTFFRQLNELVTLTRVWHGWVFFFFFLFIYLFILFILLLLLLFARLFVFVFVLFCFVLFCFVFVCFVLFCFGFCFVLFCFCFCLFVCLFFA